jgi:expansin (peptidoglycan-binding protein)
MSPATTCHRHSTTRTLCVVFLTVCLAALVSCNNNVGELQQRPSQLSCKDAPPIHYGEATYYDFANGAGNCGFDSTPNDLMVGAMNHTDYAGSYICGSCVEITGPKSDIIDIRIVDQCPECPQGNIDLSPLAFSKIAALSLGRVSISWHLIPCNVTGPVIYHFKDHSNQWWTAVQMRNHRYPIASFEYQDKGSFVSVPRLDYNYFVQENGMGPGPYIFRVTDLYGHVIIDSNVAAADNANVQGKSQFPPCN